MRVENTNIKLTIPIPVDRPDKNGAIHTKEAIENALSNPFFIFGIPPQINV